MNDKIELVPLGDLFFDAENPRLPTLLKNKSEKEVIEWMLTDASLLDLMTSIAQNGFFQGEPLLCVKIKKKIFVIEGNRRLAAVKLLNNPHVTKTKQSSIAEILEEAPHQNIPTLLPIVLFSSRDDILDYLGYRHITGVESWGPLAKARYLDQLYCKIKKSLSEKEKYKSLAKKIGSKTDYVRNLLVGYQLYKKLEDENFYKIENLNEETIEFSHLYDSLRFPNICNFLKISTDSASPTKELNKEHFKEFATWLYKEEHGTTRLGESRNLKVLDKVLASPRAIQAFRKENKTLVEASYFSKHTEDIFAESMNEALKNLNIAREFATKIEEFSLDQETNAKELNKISKMILSYIEDHVS